MASNRTSNYIATIPMKNEEQVLEVKKVLELTKVTSVIKLFSSIDDALGSF